ncbi:uncharacterized protein LOC142333042 isoform X3 [Lycorma delicatula]|uniref:uncharacterized protein LOC142333042 isoform X3 n=1 Tax=Lycorma delicatula TaxID=130591 RepID=UPI003F518C43
MRIIIYVMSFFIFSVENAYNENRLNTDISKLYRQHEKYQNLQTRCLSVKQNKGFEDYIKGMYIGIHDSYLSGCIGETNLDKLRKHTYYENDVIQLKIFEERRNEKQNELLPTLLQLLDAIPGTLTRADSIVSGIDITETIPAPTNKNSHIQTYTNIPSRLPCDTRNPETNYGSLQYVIMDNTVIYAYYKCGTTMQKIKFQLSDEENEKKIFKKIDTLCSLRLNIKEMKNDFFDQLTPILNRDEERSMKKLLQFELQFSYICKFVSPVSIHLFKCTYVAIKNGKAINLQVFENKKILQYKILNFTVSGYQLKSKCVGLTYCLQHLNINNYDFPFEEHFLTKFVVKLPK